MPTRAARASTGCDRPPAPPGADTLRWGGAEHNLCPRSRSSNTATWRFPCVLGMQPYRRRPCQMGAHSSTCSPARRGWKDAPASAPGPGARGLPPMCPARGPRRCCPNRWPKQQHSHTTTSNNTEHNNNRHNTNTSKQKKPHHQLPQDTSRMCGLMSKVWRGWLVRANNS